MQADKAKPVERELSRIPSRLSAALMRMQSSPAPLLINDPRIRVGQLF